MVYQRLVNILRRLFDHNSNPKTLTLTLVLTLALKS